jgi:biotin transport system permease protein
MIGGHLYPRTWLHSVPAGLKLLALLAAATFFLTQSAWWMFALAIAAVLCAYTLLGRQALKRLTHLRPLVPLLAVIYLLQWYMEGHNQAAVSAGRLLLMILLADLVTMTTTVQEMLDAIAPVLRPLERFGIDSRKLALAIALVIRFVPVLFDLWTRRREAWQARTARRISPMLIKAFVIDTFRMADHVAEALDARGFDASSAAARKRN